MMSTFASNPIRGPIVGMAIIVALLTYSRQAHGFLSTSQRQNITSYVKDIVECRKVPGLVLGIVFGDANNPEDVLTTAFGFSDVERELPVTTSTQFALGSLSATFTTTLVSKLLHNNKDKYPQGWDTTVKQILGDDFKLFDPLRTEYTTLRDLAAHKTGYPEYLNLMGGLDHGVKRTEYCSRYYFLKPKYEFRTGYHYSKEMVTLLGCVAEVLGNGFALEELMDSYLFKPLQMESTSFVNTADNLAVPYVLHNDSTLPLDMDLLRTIYPCEAAEGVVSTGEDMVRWLNYHRDHVKNLSRIQEGPVMEQTYLPQVQYELNAMTEFEPISRVNQVVFAHNLGWESGQYRGFRFIQQSGKLPGYTSKMAVFRDYQLGIFISMNSGPAKMDSVTTDVIMWYIADLLLHHGRPLHLMSGLACVHEYPFAHEGLLMPGPLSIQPTRRPQFKNIQTTTSAPKESNWMEAFLGSYGHRTFGNITVSYDSQEKALVYETGVIGNGTLQETGATGVFRVKFKGPLSFMHKVFPEKNITLHFKEVVNGQYIKLRLPDDQLEFERSETWAVQSYSSATALIGDIFLIGIVLAILSTYSL